MILEELLIFWIFLGQRFAMMEEKVLLANILRKFEIKSLKTIEELEPVLEIVLKPSKEMLLEFTLRKRNY